MRNKYYAQFYTLGVLSKQPIPACGSMSVLILDGRSSSRRMNAEAADEAKKRGYVGYTLHFGTFTNPVRSTKYASVTGKTDLQTVSERITARNR